MQKEKIFPVGFSVLLCAYTLFCQLVPAFGDHAVFSGAFLLISAVFVCFTIRSPLNIALIAIPAFLLVTSSGSLSLGALALSVCLGAGYGAFLFTTAGRLWLLPPLLSFPLALLGGASLSTAVCTLIPWVLAVVLYWCLERGFTRTQTFCRIAAAALLLLFVLFALHLVLTYGSDNPFPGMTALLGQAREAQTEAIVDWLSRTSTMAGEQATAAATLLTASVFNVLPAVLIILCLMVAFYADMVALSLFKACGVDDQLEKVVYYFSMTVYAAIVFVAAFLVSLIFGSSTRGEMAAVVAENIYLVMMPMMVYAGFGFVMRALLASRFGFMWIFLAMMVVFYSPGLLLMIVAFVGAVSRLLSAIWHRPPRPNGGE